MFRSSLAFANACEVHGSHVGGVGECEDMHAKLHDFRRTSGCCPRCRSFKHRMSASGVACAAHRSPQTPGNRSVDLSRLRVALSHTKWDAVEEDGMQAAPLYPKRRKRCCSSLGVATPRPATSMAGLAQGRHAACTRVFRVLSRVGGCARAGGAVEEDDADDGAAVPGRRVQHLLLLQPAGLGPEEQRRRRAAWNP